MHFNYHIQSLSFKYHNECDQKCEKGYCTPEWSSDNHENTNSEKFEGGSIIYPSNCGMSCKGLLMCKHGFVYDSPTAGPVTEIEVLWSANNVNYSNHSWILVTGHTAENCRPGKFSFQLVIWRQYHTCLSLIYQQCSD